MLSSERDLPQRPLEGAEKLLEERPGVVRTGGGLRVILDPEDWQLAMTQTLDRPVIQIHVGHLELPGVLNRSLISLHRKAVVLRCDENPARIDFLHRMISSAMPVRHLHSG